MMMWCWSRFEEFGLFLTITVQGKSILFISCPAVRSKLFHLLLSVGDLVVKFAFTEYGMLLKLVSSVLKFLLNYTNTLSVRVHLMPLKNENFVVELS